MAGRRPPSRAGKVARMSAAVEIWTGPARSGKTARLLEEYRAALRESLRRAAPGTTLWLSPTRRARQSVLRALPDRSLTACFAPNVMTFDDFADRILAASHRELRPLHATARRLLAATMIADLARTDQLQVFGPIARTPGFVDLVLGFLSELKRNETWPEHFLAACRARGLTEKDRELALIYERYQQILLEQKLYDAEGRFWSARNALKEGHRAPFEQLALVVVDGFTDFTHTQYEILSHLAGWAERLIVSLPGDRPGRSAALARTDLFAKCTAAAERIAEAIPEAVHVAAPPHASSGRESASDAGDEPAAPALPQIAEWLFTNPRETPHSADAQGLEILAATGQTGEVRAVTERVKSLLLAGVAPDEIVVAVRSLDDYADQLIESFAAAGIPHWCRPPGDLSQAPALKLLLAVLRMELEGWPFERLKSVLLSRHFRPGARGEFDGRERARAIGALRGLLVASGRTAFLKGLARQAEGASGETSDRSNDARAARQGAAEKTLSLIQRLSEATERLRASASFADWVDRLISLAHDLGLSPARGGANETESAGGAGAEREIWENFEGTLYSAARTIAKLEAGGARLTLAEFTELLVDLLRAQRLPARRGEAGRVLILDAADVRNLDVPHLFLAGLTESSFPRVAADDCLYNEHERQRLNAEGLLLGHRSSRGQDEMLLFYDIVTRARRSLVLSYPSISAAGQPMFPSPYVAAIRDLFSPEALRVEPVGQLDPVPKADQILSPADLRLVATHAVREKRPGLFRTLCELPDSEAAARNILAAVDAAVARFGTRGFTEYEGMLRLARHKERLKERFPVSVPFSATQLERYAGCPYQYFLSELLGLRELETAETQTDYRERGSLLHNVLAALHRPPAPGEPPHEERFPEKGHLVEAFRALIDQHLDLERERPPLHAALVRIERAVLHDIAEAYGDQWENYRKEFARAWGAPPRTRHVETSFGDARRKPDDEPASSLDGLRFGEGPGETRIGGRIDRIDVGEHEERPVFNVIDYKTGKPPRFSLDDVAHGTSLQLALYLFAVLRLSLAGRDARPFLMGYWSLRESGFQNAIKGTRKNQVAALSNEMIGELESILHDVVPRLAAGIRHGLFPVTSLIEDCTKYCPYSTVCRVNQVLPLAEKLAKVRPDEIASTRDSESEE